MKEKMTFEQAMEGLQQAAETLEQDDLTLEEAMQVYEKGQRYYTQCHTILQQAKQKIKTIQKADQE